MVKIKFNNNSRNLIWLNFRVRMIHKKGPGSLQEFHGARLAKSVSDPVVMKVGV